MVKQKRERSTAAIDDHVGARIRERRIMLGLTQQQLAEVIGVTYQQAHFLVTELRQHRLVTAERLLTLGVKPTHYHTVVAHEEGSPEHPVVLTAWCRRHFGKLHGLRRTHASQLLGAGVNVKAVSSRLGHSSASLTLSTCAQLLPGADQDAAQRVNDLLSGSKRVASAP
jgi:integrase